MTFIDKALDIVKGGVKIGDKATTNQDERNALLYKITKAELDSDSDFVKFARSSVIYFGLFVMFCEIFGIRLIILSHFPNPEMLIHNSTMIMEFFLVTWGGVVGVYGVGRSREKIKMRPIIENRLQKIREAEVEMNHQKKVNNQTRRRTRRQNKRKPKN